MRFSACVLALSLALTAPGCKKPQPPSAAPASAPAANRGSPEEVAKGLLSALRDELAAIARRDRPAAKDARARAALFANRAALEKLIDENPRFRFIVGDDVVDGYIQNWSAMIAFYADGLDLDHLSADPPMPGARKAVVRVPAQAAGDKTVIEVECGRDDNGVWSVSSLEFESVRRSAARAPTASTLPASRETLPAATNVAVPASSP